MRLSAHVLLFDKYDSTGFGSKSVECLPEDVGGPWGYAEDLQAMADPDHERHEELMEWRGPFNPDAFDAKKTTREMKKVK